MPLERSAWSWPTRTARPSTRAPSAAARRPYMAPQLRKAAAAAREVLIDLAAARVGGRARASLTVADGKVDARRRRGRRARLRRADRRARSSCARIAGDVAADAAPSTGRSPAARSPKVDGRDIVTGPAPLHLRPRAGRDAARQGAAAAGLRARRSPRSTRPTPQALPGVVVVATATSSASPRRRTPVAARALEALQPAVEADAAAVRRPRALRPAAASRPRERRARAGRGRPHVAGSVGRGAADGRAPSRGDLHDRLHRPRPARAARRRRRVERTAS